MRGKERAGIYVKSLFALLRLLGIKQQAVADTLELPRSVVSEWATGRRPVPRWHREAFEAFVWEALGRKNDVYLEAMERELGSDLQRWMRGDVATEPLIWQDPGPDAPLVVQQWWAFHREALRLMDEWETELRPPQHSKTIRTLCRGIGRFGRYDEATLTDMLDGPEGDTLLQLFQQGHELLRARKRLDPCPQAEVGRRVLMARRRIA